MKHGGNRKKFAGRLSAIKWLQIGALAAGTLWWLPALPAQDAAQGTGQPARAVRLSYVYGKVALSQNGQVLADQAVANTPLFEGTTLSTTGTGRAEIQFEDGSVARLAPDSSLTLKVLSGQGASGEAEMALGRGLGYFELQNHPDIGPIEVQFGDSTVTTSGFTVLRITMDTPPGELAVFSGNAHLERSGGLAVDLHGGESITLNRDNPSDYKLAQSIQPDSWDAWNSDRDQALTTEAANQTQAPQNLGENNGNNPAWNGLNAYGTWYDVPDQGDVWSPYAAASAGFDPYANGDWMWTPGYGYIWASGYPWGYMPFQCGAWNFYGGFGWGWAPGFGGCQPWWVNGFYGGPNIGFAPPGYFPIQRPLPGPIGHFPRYPHRPIRVHRHPTVMTAGLPSRKGNAPVVIDGQKVRALRPQPSRHAFLGAGNRAAPVYTRGAINGSAAARGNAFAGNRPGYAPHNEVRPVYMSPRTGFSSRGSAFPNPGFSPPSQGRPSGGFPARPAGPPPGGFHEGEGGGGFHGGGGAGFHGGGGGAHGGGGGGGHR